MPSRRQFLKTGLGVGLVTLLSGSGLGQEMQIGTFKAGAGRADVTFAADLYPLDGFVGLHDPLAVRVLLLESGIARVAIAVIDLTSISEEMVTGMKATLAEVAGVTASHTIVCASHTFSAPHVFTADTAPPGTDTFRNAAALVAFESALRKATKQAVAMLQPARIGAGQGTTRVNVNRDVATSHGWWLGADDTGFADPSVGVLRINDSGGWPLAIVTNVAVQSSITDGSERVQGGKLISADLAGAVARHVEAHYGASTVALFLVGAAGDQAPYLQANRHVVAADGSVGRIDIHEAGFALVDILGKRLGGEVVRVVEGISAQPVTRLDVRRERVEVTSQEFSPHNAATGPVTAFSYTPGMQTGVPVVLISLGPIALVGLQPELAASIGAKIRADSPFPHTLVVTMVDGAAKYLPYERSYDRYTYEARSSPYARGAAETVAVAITDLLQRMGTL